MSIKSRTTNDTKNHKKTLDTLINEMSPKSFSSNELDEIMSLSDTSIDTNGKLVRRKMPIWPKSSSSDPNHRNDNDDEPVASPTTDASKEERDLNDEDRAKADVEAAAAAADALGKDLEAMGYDLECRSFIKKHGEDSFTAQSMDNDDNNGIERYTSTNTVAPFSEEDEQNNNNDVLKLLRSTSDLIEATRSSSDLIVALRSMSSEENNNNNTTTAMVEPIASVLSSGTGPMMIIHAPQQQQTDEISITSNNNNPQPQPQPSHQDSSNQSMSSRKSYKSFRSQKSHRTSGSNNHLVNPQNNNPASIASMKSQRTQKTNRTSTSSHHRSGSSRTSTKIHIEKLPKQQLDQQQHYRAPVVVETVTSIPSTLSQYNIQYTTTSGGDDDEPLMILASPSRMAAILPSNTVVPDVVVHDETVVVSSSVHTDRLESPIEVTDMDKVNRNKKVSKALGTSKNLETGSYHIASTLPSLPPKDSSSRGESSSSERLPNLLRSTSEGGKPTNGKHRKLQRSPQRSLRHPGLQKDGTVKSTRSYWSVKGESKTSRRTKSRSPNDHEDDVSEVWSMASSRAAPPFSILSIPMKGMRTIPDKKPITTGDNVSTKNQQRPPCIPKDVSSQRSTVTTKSKKMEQANNNQDFIETKRSVDSRTHDEMSPEGMEMTTIEKNDDIVITRDDNDKNESNNDVGITSAPSVESKSSTKKILKTFSMGSKASSSKRSNKGTIEAPVSTTKETPIEDIPIDQLTSPRKEDMLGITSNLSVEEDDEKKAKEQEQIARQLILANTVERQRRIRRSLHARDTLLKLVQQKESDDKLESMTLPPTFEHSNPTMRSAAMTAPAHVEYNSQPIVPSTTTSMTTMPREAPPSFKNNSLTSPNSDMCDESIASDVTPKVRGGARIFNFLSFSPEKRQRIAKVNKQQAAPLSKTKILQVPTFGRRTPSSKQPEIEKRQNKATKKVIHHRSLFSLMKKDGAKPRSTLFSRKKKDKPTTPSKNTSEPPEVTTTKDIETTTDEVSLIPKKPKVTYVDLDESFDAIEVEFSKSPDSFSATLPPMLGTDTVLEKIVEEGSFEDVKSNSSNADDAPVYNVQPLVISPIHGQTNPTNEDMLTLTRQAALDDLKKVGATMIASTTDRSVRNSGEMIRECEESPPKQNLSFFSVVDKWFFDPLNIKAASTTLKMNETTKADPIIDRKLKDWVNEGKELTGKVVSPIMSKDREKTLEYLDQELKSREENSLKSITELEERIIDGSLLYDRAVPTHLILNNANDDDGSCLTALDSTLTRTKTENGFLNGKDDVSALSEVLTMDQWNEIAEAAYTVERALKNIEQSGGLKSTKSDANNSKPSFAFINDEVEDALHILSKHAARLGVSESDILMALGGSYDDETEMETMDPSILAQQLSRSPGPRRRRINDEDGDTATMDEGTTNSLTIDEEILEVLQMYMAKK